MMKSMTVTKPDMALLSREELTQATFGTLCQSFAMQILDRGGYQDGMYQRVALEFLEEEEEQSRQPVQNVFNIDLNVILETIRKEAQEQKREKKETEKLLEQVLRIQQAAEQTQTTIRQTSRAERTYLLAPQHTTVTRQAITVHNSFHHHGAEAQRRQLRQAAEQAEREFRTQSELLTVQGKPIPGGPGSLSSRTTQFVKQVQDGRDLMQPGTSPMQIQPVIPGRKIEANSTLQQAVRPAAELELKQEPAQTPETAKATADAVAEVMKTAVERQLQQLRPVQASEKNDTKRQSDRQEEGKLSRPTARQKQGQSITEQTTGRETQKSPSVPHIQRQEQPAAAREEKSGNREKERTQMLQPFGKREPLTQNLRQDIRITGTAGRRAARQEKAAASVSVSAADRGKELSPGREMPNSTGKQAEPMAMGQTAAEQKVSVIEEQAKASPQQKQEPRTLSPEQTKLPQTYAPNLTQADLQFLSDSQREQVQAALKQDAQPIGQRDIRVAAQNMEPSAQPEVTKEVGNVAVLPPAGTEELHFRQEEAEQPSAAVQPQQKQEPRTLSPEYTTLLQTYAPNLTQADLQFLSDSQREQVQAAMKQGASPMQPVGQRDIRVTGGGQEPTAAQEQSKAPTVFTTMGSQELAFRLSEEEATKSQPENRQTQAAAEVQTQSRQDSRTLSPEYTKLLQTYASNLTQADLQFLSDSQRAQVQAVLKQGAQPTETVGQRDIRVAAQPMETSTQLEVTKEAENAAYLPLTGMEELTFRQEEAGQPSAAVQPQQKQDPRTLSPEYTKLLQTYASNLTQEDLQFLSESQRAQVQEVLKQGAPPVQPVGQRDIRVAGSVLEPTVTQEQSKAPAVFSTMGSQEELAFRLSEEVIKSQPENRQTQAAAEVQTQSRQDPRALSPEYTKLLQTYAPNLTQADLQFLSESQRAQVREVLKLGVQPVETIGQRDIRVAAQNMETSAQQEVAKEVGNAAYLPPAGTEELHFRQEAEQQTVPVVQSAEHRNGEYAVIGKQPTPAAAVSKQTVSRDIRVLSGQSDSDSAGAAEEPPFVGAAPYPTDADLAFLTEDRRQAMQTEPIRPQTGTMEQVMQPTAMEELQHRQPLQETPAAKLEDTAVQTQRNPLGTIPADIRVLRQLNTIHGMDRQTLQSQEAQTKLPAPVGLQLPTGSDAAYPAAQTKQTAEQQNTLPVELTYSPAMVLQQSQPPQDPTARTASAKPAGSYVSSLPQWAQSFVQSESGGAAAAGMKTAAPISGVARDIASLSGNVIGGEGQMVDWSSPNRAQLMNQAAQRPAEVVFKEKPQEDDRQSRPMQMSESELRRTADKIYHMIEDRIRRERRLLGL